MAAVFLFVVVGGFIAYAVTQSNVQQTTTVADVQSARAYQAARAGLEWAAYRVLRSSSCGGATLAFAGTTLADFSTTVACTSTSAVEGAATITTYQVTATACNATPCPNPAPNSVYAERQLSLTLSKCTAGC